MDETTDHNAMPGDLEHLADGNSMPGIISELGELTPGSIITEEGMARLFHRHVVSVKRAVQRRELPPPCRLFGVNVWTAGALVRYIEKRLDEAAETTELVAKRHAKLSPATQRQRGI